MYPWCRLAKVFLTKNKRKPIGVGDVSILKSRVCLTDLDPFFELNNGRYLTLFDFGRYDVAMRTGLWKTLKKQNWGLMVAGISIRYRYRLRLFTKFEIHSRVVGIDHRWFYFEQKFVSKGKLHTSALVRTAITSPKGLVPTGEVLKALGTPDVSIPVPDWINEWAKSDEMRPWE
jgi:acyl-CoA thioesterase FadM